jgi:mono/diheme cytochrome c family protein
MTTAIRIGLALALLPLPARADDALFPSRVAPVIKKRCIECHNPRKSRGGLDLSVRESLLKGGDQGEVIVPGKADKSLLVEQISGTKPAMPKKGSALTSQEVADIRRWIDAGAPWPKGMRLQDADGRPVVDANWWSLRPLSRPPQPAVKETGWVRNPIDRFILSKLEEKGLKPSPEADRRTLFRRVTYDLHGLPPSPEEIAAFERDSSPDAYEQLIDRLLTSPRYGERWGRHWLDVVHYADTHGYDKDKRRDHAWPYRDYVIRSFNEDRPYGRFIREQIAGDVLYPHSLDGIVATGFIAAGPWDFVGHVELREGTVDKLKTRLIDRDDMLSNTMSTFVSMTVHCARCHDHKFDPITQTDYYRLQAVFSGVDRGDRAYESTPAARRRLALEARKKELLAKRAEIDERIASLSVLQLVFLDAELSRERTALASLPQPKGRGPSPTNGYHSGITLKPDVTKWVQVDLGRSLPLEELRLLPARPTDFRDSPGFGFPQRFQVAISDDPTFARAELIADHSQKDFPNPGDTPVRLRLEGKKARYIRVTALRLWKRLEDYCFALAELQAISGGKNVALNNPVTALDSIEAGRWSRSFLVDDCDSRQRLTDLSDPALAKREELEKRIAKKEQQRKRLLDQHLDEATRKSLAQMEKDLPEIEKQLAASSQSDRVYAVVPHSPRPIHVLPRGDVEKPGPVVVPGALTCVPALTPEFKLSRPEEEGQRRAALAEWIADTRNVLTWRSVVNRIWHYHFGKGIVDTPNDFGGNGSKPTHPELLDWLAVEFQENGASWKKLHRLILLSSTYRQQSRYDEASAKVDADNRYLWRMSRHRLDAESIRDSVLAVSGRLDLSMGGPGFELFRFKDEHSPIYDHTALETILDPRTYRRTVYRFTVRSVPNPFLDCLDCADPNVNTPVRNTTLTALQALSLLNNPFMVKQAEFFAERLKKENADLAGLVDRGYLLAFGRVSRGKERAALIAHAQKHGLASVCRLLFNANEFVFID